MLLYLIYNRNARPFCTSLNSLKMYLVKMAISGSSWVWAGQPTSANSFWLVPCMAANRRWSVNVCVNGWMTGINCTALWIKALHKCSPFTIYHFQNIAWAGQTMSSWEQVWTGQPAWAVFFQQGGALTCVWRWARCSNLCMEVSLADRSPLENSAQ